MLGGTACVPPSFIFRRDWAARRRSW